MQTEQEDINEIMDEFDFVKVKKVMDALDWEWGSEGVPYIGDMRKHVRELFTIASVNNSEMVYAVSSGGFHILRTIFPGDSKRYYSLSFVVTWKDNHG